MGKTAIITGSARGIGAAIALRLAKDGYDIALNDISEKSFENNDIMERITALGVRCEKYIADGSGHEDCESFVKKVKEDFGSIDALVNNAGVTRDGLLLRMAEVTCLRTLKGPDYYLGGTGVRVWLLGA